MQSDGVQGHRQLVLTLDALGYRDIDAGGTCQGVAMTGVQALLMETQCGGAIDTFNRRWQTFARLMNLCPATVQQLALPVFREMAVSPDLEEQKKHKIIVETCRSKFNDHLDLLSWFDSVVLYQHPCYRVVDYLPYKEGDEAPLSDRQLLREGLHGPNPAPLLPLLSPVGLDGVGGLSFINAMADGFTEGELTFVLEKVADFIERYPLAIVVTGSLKEGASELHSIAIGCDKNGSWHLVDASQMPMQKAASLRRLVQKMLALFSPREGCNYPLALSYFCHHRDRNEVKKALDELKAARGSSRDKRQLDEETMQFILNQEVSLGFRSLLNSCIANKEIPPSVVDQLIIHSLCFNRDDIAEELLKNFSFDGASYGFTPFDVLLIKEDSSIKQLEMFQEMINEGVDLFSGRYNYRLKDIPNKEIKTLYIKAGGGSWHQNQFSPQELTQANHSACTLLSSLEQLISTLFWKVGFFLGGTCLTLLDGRRIKVPSTVAAQYKEIEKAKTRQISYLEAAHQVIELGSKAKRVHLLRHRTTRCYYDLFVRTNWSALQLAIERWLQRLPSS